MKACLYDIGFDVSRGTWDDDEQNHKYDAYVVYAREDEDFAEDYFVEELERGEVHYRVCIKARDWVPGQHREKLAIKSVDESRRVVVVLSPDFLRCADSVFSFITAHCRTMKGVTTRVIVVMYRNVIIDEVENEELRGYLRKYSYLKWGDRLFWTKLRYVLPHKK